MQVEAEHAIGAGGADQVRHQLRGDRHPRVHLAILPGVAEVGNHCRDAARRAAAQRIHHDQQLHDVAIRGCRGRLHHEAIHAAHVLAELDHDLAVAEVPDIGLADLDVEIVRHRIRQSGAGIARKIFRFAISSIRQRSVHRPSRWLGRQDSNLQMAAPKAAALPIWRRPRKRFGRKRPPAPAGPRSAIRHPIRIRPSSRPVARSQLGASTRESPFARFGRVLARAKTP